MTQFEFQAKFRSNLYPSFFFPLTFPKAGIDCKTVWTVWFRTLYVPLKTAHLMGKSFAEMVQLQKERMTYQRHESSLIQVATVFKRPVHFFSRDRR